MTYQPQRFAAPDGTELVVLAATDYDRLRLLADDGVDARDASDALARIEQGGGTMPGEVLSNMLNGSSALAAWRRYRGLSQAALAARSGLSQVWVGRIESGRGYGSRSTRRKLAAALDAPEWALDDAAEEPLTSIAVAVGKGAKYAPLRDHLAQADAETVTMRFAEVADFVGGLPKSAGVHRAWWGNHEGNSQALGWMRARYLAEPDMAHRVVTFRRFR